jgi:hypothetical protein
VKWSREHFLLIHIKVDEKRVLCYNGLPSYTLPKVLVELAIEVIQNMCKANAWKDVSAETITCEIVPIPYLQVGGWECALWCVAYMHCIARRIPLCAVDDVTGVFKAALAWHIYVKEATIKPGVKEESIDMAAYSDKFKTQEETWKSYKETWKDCSKKEHVMGDKIQYEPGQYLAIEDDDTTFYTMQGGKQCTMLSLRLLVVIE